jgi:hypothetical protein
LRRSILFNRLANAMTNPLTPVRGALCARGASVFVGLDDHVDVVRLDREVDNLEASL